MEANLLAGWDISQRGGEKSMISSKHGTMMEVDIHGLTADDARRQLEQFLSRVAPSITEVVVIHGYNGGQVLMNMVRNQLKHPRIASKMISLNSGQTRILLKPKP